MSQDLVRIPTPVYILGFTIFAMTTSEYMVAGLMTSMSTDLQVGIPEIGYLITIYSLGMVFGGPLLATFLVRFSNKTALLMITGGFLAAQVVGTVSPDYNVLAFARFVTGLTSAAFFGFALLAASKLVPPSAFGVAASVVLGGMMIAMVAGLPISALLSQYFGWRTAFWLVAFLVTIAAVAILTAVPNVSVDGQTTSMRSEVGSIMHGPLWAAYATSFLVISATFAAFSYFVPFLEAVAGFSANSIPWILFAYGACSVVGNFVVGRIADRAPIAVVVVGSCVLIVSLIGLYSSSGNTLGVVLWMMLLGSTGITLTPAMSSRVFRAVPNTSLINTMHTSVICLGVVVGSWGGGVVIGRGYGFDAPLLVAAALATLALITILPIALKRNESARHVA